MFFWSVADPALFTFCRLFRYDPQRKGHLTSVTFFHLMNDLGIKMDRKESDRFMSKFVEDATRMTFNELFFKLMGLPDDFFRMKLTGDDLDLNQQPESVELLRKRLCKGTSFAAAEKIFKTGLRQMLFNVDQSLNLVFERPSNAQSEFDKDELWTMLNARGFPVTAVQLDELMAYYDTNCDGKIDYSEFAYEVPLSSQ